MKLLVVSVLTILSLGALAVQGLQCYTCGSSTSMDDCSSQQIKTTCPRQLPSTYCGKVQVKDTSGAVPKIFIKGCFSEDFCEGNVFPCNQTGVECQGDCCFYDLCNGEGGTVQSLSCHHCTSSTSLEDCTNQQQIRQCPFGWNRCGMMEFHSQEKTSFLKGCFTEQSCQKVCAGGSIPEIGMECELSCCEKSLCNWAFTVWCLIKLVHVSVVDDN